MTKIYTTLTTTSSGHFGKHVQGHAADNAVRLSSRVGN